METNQQETNVQIHQHDIFTIIETKTTNNGKSKKEFQIALGDTIVSQKKFKTITQAKEYINTPNWEMLVNTFCLIYQKMQNNEIK